MMREVPHRQLARVDLAHLDIARALRAPRPSPPDPRALRALRVHVHEPPIRLQPRRRPHRADGRRRCRRRRDVEGDRARRERRRGAIWQHAERLTRHRERVRLRLRLRVRRAVVLERRELVRVRVLRGEGDRQRGPRRAVVPVVRARARVGLRVELRVDGGGGVVPVLAPARSEGGPRGVREVGAEEGARARARAGDDADTGAGAGAVVARCDLGFDGPGEEDLARVRERGREEVRGRRAGGRGDTHDEGEPGADHEAKARGDGEDLCGAGPKSHQPLIPHKHTGRPRTRSEPTRRPQKSPRGKR